MARLRLQKLLEKVETEIIRAESIAKSTREAALEINRVAAGSPSSSGDREHAMNQASLNEQKTKQLRILREELAGEVSKETPNLINPPCYFSVNLKDIVDIPESYYLVNNLANLGGLITPNSPLGEEVLGKKIGDEFEFKAGDRYIKGKITSVQ